MLSLSKELNEALDLWASLLPKTLSAPPVEQNQAEQTSLRVPDSLPLLWSMGHFFQQTAWQGEPVLEAEEKPKETPASFTATPLQNSVAIFFENTNWNNRENLIQGQEAGSLEEPSDINRPGMRLHVDDFFRKTAWQGVSLQERAGHAMTPMLSFQEEKESNIDNFFEDIRW